MGSLQMSKKFKIMLVYDSGQRYIFPFELIKEVLELTDEQVKKVEDKILVEIQK